MLEVITISLSTIILGIVILSHIMLCKFNKNYREKYLKKKMSEGKEFIYFVWMCVGIIGLMGVLKILS